MSETCASGSMRALVDDALACVAKECPEAHHAMKTALGDRRLALDIDGDRFEVSLATTERHRTVAIRTRARVLRDILLGERDPLDAILADEVSLHGDVEDLVAVGEVGLFFVKGAVRCRSMDPMIVQLEQLAGREG